MPEEPKKSNKVKYAVVAGVGFLILGGGGIVSYKMYKRSTNTSSSEGGAKGAGEGGKNTVDAVGGNGNKPNTGSQPNNIPKSTSNNNMGGQQLHSDSNPQPNQNGQQAFSFQAANDDEGQNGQAPSIGQDGPASITRDGPGGRGGHLSARGRGRTSWKHGNAFQRKQQL